MKHWCETHKSQEDFVHLDRTGLTFICRRCFEQALDFAKKNLTPEQIQEILGSSSPAPFSISGTADHS